MLANYMDGWISQQNLGQAITDSIGPSKFYSLAKIYVWVLNEITKILN